MCGIVGFVQAEPLLDGQRLSRMRDALTHRGPDGAGAELWNDRGETCADDGFAAAGFGHRRLSIIDLSEAGRQPMANEDGSVWITYNGEFYNFGDYRMELEAQGHVFRSRCDTETILHLYEQHGMEETLRRMNGMYAFGLYDLKARKLLLARDRTGQKPLYYAELPGGGLIFASEIKALLASGHVDASRLDPVGMAQSWMFGYPHGGRTVYAQIRQLPAGHWAEWVDGRLAVHEYWDCPFGLDVRESASLESLTDELEALLSDAIRMRLISDVPIGLFLSGGIDSSLMAALTAKSLRRDLASYTISFDQAEYDESPHAASIARHLGIRNEVLPVTDRMAPAFPVIADQFDMPFGDSSAIPTYFVSKAARRHVTVVLTGDAGDELFGGYNWYKFAMHVLENAPYGREYVTFNWRWLWRMKLFGARNGFGLFARVMGSRRARQALFAGDLLAASGSKAVWKERRDWHRRVRGADRLAQMQYLDLKAYLEGDILVKVDRMSMAHSLECRSPMLDYRVIEFASRLPRAAKIGDDGKGKRILRHLLARYVPESLFDRPKRGFGVPWATWCDAAMRQRLSDQWQAMNHPWFRPEGADHLFPDDGGDSTHLQWNAYTAMRFLEANRREVPPPAAPEPGGTGDAE